MRYSNATSIRQKLLRAIQDGRFGSDTKLPSIRDFAESLSASTTTVRKAINQLCEEGILEVRGTRGTFVKTQSSQNGKTVGLLYARKPGYLEDSPRYPGQVVKSLKRALKTHGYTVKPCSLTSIDLLNMQDTIREMGFAALLLFEIDSESLALDLKALNLPTVSIDSDFYRMGISSVCFDNPGGMFQLTKAFIERGHEHIAFLRPLHTFKLGDSPILNSVEDDRILGYRLAMEDAGLEVRDEEYDPTEPRRFLDATLMRLLSHNPKPTAFVCADDNAANLIARRLKHFGHAVPEDISISGFGNTAPVLANGKRVATVQTDNAGMGRSAAELLLERMKSASAKPRRIVLKTKVILNETIAERKPLAAST